jgi:hypothetical protein
MKDQKNTQIVKPSNNGSQTGKAFFLPVYRSLPLLHHSNVPVFYTSRSNGVRLSNPSSVTRIVCSNWADRELSSVTAVQLSDRI